MNGRLPTIQCAKALMKLYKDMGKQSVSITSIVRKIDQLWNDWRLVKVNAYKPLTKYLKEKEERFVRN